MTLRDRKTLRLAARLRDAEKDIGKAWRAWVKIGDCAAAEKQIEAGREHHRAVHAAEDAKMRLVKHFCGRYL